MEILSLVRNVDALINKLVDQRVNEKMNLIFKLKVSDLRKFISDHNYERTPENDQDKVFEVVLKNDKPSIGTIIQKTGLKRHVVKYYLNSLRRKGKIQLVGNKKTAHYVVC